ncbi:CvfB family protein [Vagococcus silagei]|uniref:DNA-binding protein n=1 Tax=Vagococcus silagei TaxID=2508885 RepID=A0A4S3B9D4_9ENTE|nr:S1-like domain-containing RNA-binding protein [Vagococcus silagei]THB61655.1 DNA-binding protein [Vagococcus silagei]
MKELLANVWSGLVTDENDKYYYIQKNGMTFSLAKSEGTEYSIGEFVEGFGYRNQKDQLRFTTKIPKVRQDHYAFATVVAQRKDLGVFVDIGLDDKEIVLSVDELPAMKELWPKKGDHVLVKIKVDEKERVWVTLAEDTHFKAMSRAANQEAMQNKDVKGLVYRVKLVGTYVLTDDFYIAFIHPSERDMEPRLGQEVSGRVIGVRPDGVLNLSLRPRGYEVIGDDAQMILTFLNNSEDGTIPFTDKSTPEDINARFAISKASFKRALGSLMKQGLIVQEDGMTKLVNKG